MFRVVIVGGSIIGLALALMLEKNGIDYVVLEAYPEIAPQVGASIAVLPNGFRILDQLGCYEDLIKRAECSVDHFIIRDPNGKALIDLDDLHTHLTQRLGYPMIFFERRMLIEIIYNHIRNKQKVLTSKRVNNIEENDDGVTVTTTDGAVFKGDIVIGADGAHSAVRNHICPDLKKEDMPASYWCLFGISVGVPNIVRDSLDHITNNKSSLFAAAGPDDRTYWCLFFNMGEKHYGEDIPKFGEKEEEEAVRRHWNDAINEKVKFSDLYSRKSASVCTPLHEYVIGKWHSQRAMIIGDSVHKFNPIVGLGGMSGLETAAALTNHLVQLLKSKDAISSDALSSVFQKTQQFRQPRATALVYGSRAYQELFAMTSPYLKLWNRYIYPIMGRYKLLQRLTEAYPGAVSLDMLKVPPKTRWQPYEDEFPQPPQGRNRFVSTVAYATLLGISVLGVYLLHVISGINGTWALVRQAVGAGVIPELDVPIRSVFGLDSVPALDKLSRSLITVFLPAVSGVSNFASKIQAGYFLISVFLPLLALMAIEGYRKRNVWSLVWSPSLWTGLAQLFGLGVILPLYVFASFYHSHKVSDWTPAERPLPAAASKAILPSVLLGFLVPSVLLVALAAGSPFIQETIAFWQITPFLVVVLAELFATSARPPKHKSEKSAALLEDYQNLDLPHLLRTYDVVFAIAALVHVAAVAFLGPAGFVAAFFPQQPVLGPVASVAEGMSIFFQFDLLLTVAAAFVWCLLSIYDVGRVGISTESSLNVTLKLVAGYALVGPGAATVALWKWREETMANTKPKLRVDAPL